MRRSLLGGDAKDLVGGRHFIRVLPCLEEILINRKKYLIFWIP